MSLFDRAPQFQLVQKTLEVQPLGASPVDEDSP